MARKTSNDQQVVDITSALALPGICSGQCQSRLGGTSLSSISPYWSPISSRLSGQRNTQRNDPVVSRAQAVLSVPLRGVSLAPLRSLLRPQPGLAAFAPPQPPPSGAMLADRQSSDPSNVRALI